MSRIFLVLAWFALALVATALLLGLLMGDDLRQRPSEATLVWARVHRLTGVAAALAVVLVNSIVVTYFVGTSRWCKEVVETYRLPAELIVQSNRLKRRTFPWATASMLAVVGVVALGGASDPATGRPGSEQWVTWHLLGALGGLAFVATSFIVEWNQIYAHHAVIGQIVQRVQRVRRERGLDDEPQAVADAVNSPM